MYLSILCHATISSKRNKVTPPHPMCISFVTANNIAIGEGGNGLLICDGKYFCQDECKKSMYFCNMSQEVFSRVLVIDNFMRTWIGT